MKRIALILAWILLLCACQPTPEQDAVVNKGDSEPWHETAVATTEPSAIPAHLLLTEQPQKNVTVVIDADVVLNRDSAFPILEMVPVDTAHDPAFCARLFEAVCPDGTVYEHWERTKAEVGEQLKAAVAYHGQSGSMVDQDTLNFYIGLFEQEYRNAPETVEKVRHDGSDGYAINQWYYVEHPGGVARLEITGVNDGSFYGTERMYYCPEAMLEEGDPPLAEPKLSREDAVEIGDGFIRRMGIECDALLHAEKGFTFYNYERQETIWLLDYVREIDGTATFDGSREMSYGDPVSPSSTVGAPWRPEGVRLAVGAEGVLYVGWDGLSETKKVLSEHAALCDFDEITRRMVEQLGFIHAGLMADDRLLTSEVHVKEIRLIYALLSEKDRDGVGVYLPAWEIVYTEARLPDVEQQLYLSALDGGVLEPRMTQQTLMRIAP